MKTNPQIHLPDVQAIYSGPEGRLWELIMGQQIHIGGFSSSVDLARKASIQPGSKGVDFCCCNGAGMRFLVRFCNVGAMTGVDMTEAVLAQCRQRCREDGLFHRIDCIKADACSTGLPAQSFDFVWGEDAWCYVEDKTALIREAVRILKPGGTIAVTDWVEGPVKMAEKESLRFLSFMKFPNILSIDEYRSLLESNGCTVSQAEDTGRFAPYVDLYLDMVSKQLTYDALKIIGYDLERLKSISAEMSFMQTLAHENKIIQGLFVAVKGPKGAAL